MGSTPTTDHVNFMTRRFFGKIIAQAVYGIYAAMPILASPEQLRPRTPPPEPNAIDMSAGPLSRKRIAWPALNEEAFAQRCQIAWELKHQEDFGSGLSEQFVGVNGRTRRPSFIYR